MPELALLAKLFVHYLYDEGRQRKTEIRHDFCCPWCGLFCGSLEGLLCHFTCCHDVFRFQLEEDEWANPHIKVTVSRPPRSEKRRSLSLSLAYPFFTFCIACRNDGN